MLDVTQSLSLMPQSRGAATELAAPLAVTGSLQAYQAKHAKFDAKRLFEFMALDLDNPASVLSCLRASRENARRTCRDFQSMPCFSPEPDGFPFPNGVRCFL